MIEIGTQFKGGEKIPVAGKYRCVVCKLVVDIPEHFLGMGVTFFTCPVCKAGTEGGPKEPHDEIWEYLGN